MVRGEQEATEEQGATGGQEATEEQGATEEQEATEEATEEAKVLPLQIQMYSRLPPLHPCLRLSVLLAPFQLLVGLLVRREGSLLTPDQLPA